MAYFCGAIDLHCNLNIFSAVFQRFFKTDFLFLLEVVVNLLDKGNLKTTNLINNQNQRFESRLRKKNNVHTFF